MNWVRILIDIFTFLFVRYHGYFLFDFHSDSAFGLNGRMTCTQYDTIQCEL